MRYLFWVALLIIGSAPLRAQETPASPLAEAYERAWRRQPAAHGQAWRQQAGAAQQVAAGQWLAAPPSVALAQRSDHFNRNRGATEREIGLALPLWLPGERPAAQAVATGEAAALAGQLAYERWQLAATLRRAWWAWLLAEQEMGLAESRRQAASQLADDVGQRVAAGDLAPADEHLAGGVLAVASAAVAETRQALLDARQTVRRLLGHLPPLPAVQPENPLPPGWDAEAAGDGANAPVAARDDGPVPSWLGQHPAWRVIEQQAELARQQLALRRSQDRDRPALTLSTRIDQAVRGEAGEQTWAIALHLPLSSGVRQQAALANANAALIEASQQLSLQRETLRLSADLALAQWQAAAQALAAYGERWRLAVRNQADYAKAFRLGNIDLPSRLRAEQEAVEAERRLLRARIEQAQRWSDYRQALGLLPE
ncbi:MAG: TolC family protein [Rhodocyclaceae bacterium]|nr:TolC family protein [Rhodocyclaceae bacterium]